MLNHLDKISSDEHRYRLPYIGKRRFKFTPEGTMPLPGRAFALPSGALRWSYRDQERAVDLGFFVERRMQNNSVRVLPLRNGRWRTDAEVMAWLEHEAFLRDGFAARTLLFVEQQDMYGYSGAWESATSSRFSGGIEFWSAGLLWYKKIKAERRAHNRLCGQLGLAAQARKAAQVQHEVYPTYS